MSTSYTPLPTSIVRPKSGLDLNVFLVLIALGITLLLGVLMWFLIVQKQNEEKKANATIQQFKQRTEQIVVEGPSPTSVASQSATVSPTVSVLATPTPIKATITPVASPSATITP